MPGTWGSSGGAGGSSSEPGVHANESSAPCRGSFRSLHPRPRHGLATGVIRIPSHGLPVAGDVVHPRLGAEVLFEPIRRVLAEEPRRPHDPPAVGGNVLFEV